MPHRIFADLDELVLHCDDEKARAYIGEAVASYKSGAIRAAILSTWVAVAFDFIDKVRQLELQGDPIAMQIGAELDAIQAKDDVVRSLTFERTILNRALNELGFISSAEHKDLSRLYEDRHRCVHPSMNARGEIFQPTAEQARYHIRTAVETMLSQPPTSGKAALQALVAQVEGVYFPTEVDKALVVLKSTALARSRASLVRNFSILLMKRMLLTTVDKASRLRAAAALNATKVMHPQACGEAIAEKLSSLLRALADQNYGLAIALASRIDQGEGYLEQDIKLRMEQFVAVAEPASLARIAETVANLKVLEASLHSRLESSSISDLITILGNAPTLLKDSAIKNRSVEVYLASVSFDQANSIANKLIVPLAHSFTRDQVESLVRGSFENYQVRGSFQFAETMIALRSNPNLDETWWNGLLTNVGAAGQFTQLFIGRPPTTTIAVTGDEDLPF